MITAQRRNNPLRKPIAALFAALALLPAAVAAHGPEKHDKAPKPLSTEEHAWGRQGDPAKATRTIAIGMSDAMRFTPDRIEVRQGETLRLVFRNRGKVLHEFVLGTKKALDAHAAAMQRMPDMTHDDPWMVHVPPGKTGELVWKFNRAGEFDFACLIPGHYQAGMVGKVRVAAKP